MKVVVLLFGRYREAAGALVEVEVPEPVTIGKAWDRVRAHVPALQSEGRPMLACNRVYARADTVLRGGEEVAAFPPVSGG